MKKIIVLPAFASLFFLVLACNNQSSTDSKSMADNKNEQKEDSGTINKKIDDDAEFLTEVSSGVHMEVELGTYATKNAASQKVKDFGAKMAHDHAKDIEETKALASQKNITLPTVPGDKFQKHINDLEQKKAADFDKAYISYMVSDHKDDIDEFEKEVKNGKDPDVLAYAKKGLPILKEHLSLAESINNSMK